MAGIVRVHHPDLTPEEREYRMEEIKKATILFFKNIEREKQARKKLESTKG